MMESAAKAAPLRCPWCAGDPLYESYHDSEWGRPQRDSLKLFEALILDGAQAGLSWITILRRRENYRAVFDGMAPEKIAAYDERDIDRLLLDGRIIRNRLKIESAINNARSYLALTEKEGSFSKWLWGFVDGKPIVNRFKTMEEVPAYTDLSVKISGELKRRGFSFVGPTIVYAFMQAEGLVNDHLADCFCHEICAGESGFLP